jgi:hypothetical protein
VTYVALNPVQFISSIDTKSAWNNTTYKYTCPVAGYYKIHVTLTIASTSTTNMEVGLFKNTTQVVALLFNAQGSGTKQTSNAYVVNCSVGDQLWLRANAAFTAIGNSTGSYSILIIELM